MRLTLLAIVYVAAALIAFAFLLLPIFAIFAHTSPAHLVEQLSNPVVRDAFVVSLKTSILAQLLDEVGRRRVREDRDDRQEQEDERDERGGDVDDCEEGQPHVARSHLPADYRFAGLTRGRKPAATSLA